MLILGEKFTEDLAVSVLIANMYCARWKEKNTRNVRKYLYENIFKKQRRLFRMKLSPPFKSAICALCRQGFVEQRREETEGKNVNHWCLLTNITHRPEPTGLPAGNTCCDLWRESKWEQQTHQLQSSLRHTVWNTHKILVPKWDEECASYWNLPLKEWYEFKIATVQFGFFAIRSWLGYDSVDALFFFFNELFLSDTE